MRIMLAAADAHSPLIVIGGALAVLGLVMTTLAPRSRYVETKLDKRLVGAGFVSALFGGIALVIGAAEELSDGRSLLGSIVLLGLVIGIVVVLLLPNFVGCCVRRKSSHVHESPNAIPSGKPPALWRDNRDDDKVSEHEHGAVEGQVPEPQPETNEA